MADYLIPVATALFVWWFSTGFVLWLNQLPASTHRRSLIGASILSGVALYVLAATADLQTQFSAIAAFAAAIVIWGWCELSFLLGMVTGPRREGCPEGADRWTRFGFAAKALAYHEAALLIGLGLVALVTWNGENQVGLWTYLVLFFMRLSAKLNIFLGVPNMNEEFLPKRLAYLKSYFATRPMNGLFPISVTAAALAGAYVFHAAFAVDVTEYGIAAFMLTGSLILLGTVEHWLLVLPIPDAALWRWAIRSEIADLTPIENEPETSGPDITGAEIKPFSRPTAALEGGGRVDDGMKPLAAAAASRQ
ncbi:MAG: putative photosynthetic complex assembly protein PuhE [Alphaproteobacteria bacterium]|nr:putative photosynthetic complex assembly protein PuhE [Alphaproteobacteria bacterium]